MGARVSTRPPRSPLACAWTRPGAQRPRRCEWHRTAPAPAARADASIPLLMWRREQRLCLSTTVGNYFSVAFPRRRLTGLALSAATSLDGSGRTVGSVRPGLDHLGELTALGATSLFGPRRSRQDRSGRSGLADQPPTPASARFHEEKRLPGR
jgi:hypothetical protein